MPLFVLATPIGNLSDLSARAQECLTGAALVLCEDTRQTRKLYAALGLATPPLKSCHAHNEAGRVDEAVSRVRLGESVVLVSDAGTPAVSDPGDQIVAAVHAAGLPVRAIPGPSSVASAISVAGFSASPHHFLGFPPRKSGAQRKLLTEASRLSGPLVMLESGRRVGDLIALAAELMPDREACICRELTKLHEEVVRDQLVALPTGPQRGEVVLVIGPGEPVAVEAGPVPDGDSLKSVAAALASRWGCSKRDAYQRLLALEREFTDSE